MDNESLIPIPQKTSKVKDIFVSIATLLSLGATLYSLFSLVPLLADTIMPDQFNCGCDFTSEITRYLASLIVSAGFYFYLSWRSRKDEGNKPLHHSTIFHQVIVYFAVFLSGIIISYGLVDVLDTTFYYGFTTAVAIKIIFFILIFISIVIYSRIDIKNEGDVSHSKLATVAWWVSFALVGGSIIGSFVVVGSPSFQKEKRFDEIRLSALQSIKSDIDGSGVSTLPKTLDEFYQASYVSSNLLDPEFNKPYEYLVTGENTYDLCTSFGTSSDDYAVKLKKVYAGNASNHVDPWIHEAGHTCFHFNIENYGYGSESEYPDEESY